MDIKKQILEITANMFRTYGIKSNTMEDIAQKAGISKKTLYQHFNDKTDLISQVISLEYQEFEKRLKLLNKISADPIEQLMRLNIVITELLREVNPTSVNDLNKHYKSIFEFIRDKYQNLLFTEIISNLRKGKELDIYNQDINEEIITKLHADRIKYIIDTRDSWKNMEATTDTIKEMTIYYVRGLLNDKGRALLDRHINDFNNYLK